MIALITGAGGQVGRALIDTAPAGVQAVGLVSSDLDITDAAAVGDAINRHAPTVIINAAAYTAVDRAESEAERAHAVNGAGPGIISDAARAAGVKLVHISTDFVFDGSSSRPWRTTDACAPLSVYGQSKLAGERQVGDDALIVRTAWVYADEGANFVATMLRLMRERPEVRVVDDQIGTPTHALSLASAIWALADRDVRGIYHYTDSGVASWYDFAVAIQEEAIVAGLLATAVPIMPIATADYPTPAARPAYSVLDKRETWAALGAPAPHWRVNLRAMLQRKAA